MIKHAVKREKLASEVKTERNPAEANCRMVVCVDSTDTAGAALKQSLSVADALGADILVTHVIEPDRHVLLPFDPVEWELKRREAEDYVTGLVNRHASAGRTIETSVLEGRCAEQIGKSVSGHPKDIIAVSRGPDASPWHLGDTIRRLIESGSGSILLTPNTGTDRRDGTLSRILVPLDGSARAESAVPTALSISRASGADLVLIHAQLEPTLTIAGPIGPEEAALLERVAKSNETVARNYLERVRRHISERGVKVDTAVLSGGDPRRLIIDAVVNHSADLLVMASHGRSGFADAPLGDVASFILSRSPVPVLMVRRDKSSNGDHAFLASQSKGIRRPAAAA